MHPDLCSQRRGKRRRKGLETYCPPLFVLRASPAAGRYGKNQRDTLRPLSGWVGCSDRGTQPHPASRHPSGCPTSQNDCLPLGGGGPSSWGLPGVGIPAPWRDLQRIPRGPGDAHLLSWGAWEEEPHFLSQRDPREMRPQRPSAQESLTVWGNRKPVRSAGPHCSTPKGHCTVLSFPFSPVMCLSGPGRGRRRSPDTVVTEHRPCCTGFSHQMINCPVSQPLPFGDEIRPVCQDVQGQKQGNTKQVLV